MRPLLFAVFVVLLGVSLASAQRVHSGKGPQKLHGRVSHYEPQYPDPHLPFGINNVLAVAYNKYYFHTAAFGNDSNLWTKYRAVNGTDWSDWIMLPAPTCGGLWNSDPVMGVDPDGTIELFIRSALNLDLWQFYLTDPTNPTSWSAPREAACIAPPAPCWNTQDVFPTSDVSLVYGPDRRIQLYYRGFDGFLYLVEQSEAGNPALYEPPVSMGVILE